MTRSEEELPDTSSGTMRRLGKYRLFARLGAGGMADVYLSVAEGAMNVNRLVVVKRLRDDQASDANAREMFLNEARLAARLNHPNVVQTIDASVEDGNYILTMEYVEGQTLARLLSKLQREGRKLHPRLAARILADALAGLHYAHELCDFDDTPINIVHRDVSPQNLMVTYEGMVKVLDFGIAKAAGSVTTAHGVFKGKVAFMAPEQILGDAVDRRADIFATGVVLWEAITGQPLLADSSPAKTLHNLLNKPLPRVSTVSPIPDELDDIVAKALERDVDKRYQTAKQMRDALEEYLSHGSPVAHEEIGELTKTLFADTRRKVQAKIKAQLTTLSLGRGSDPALMTDLAVPESSAKMRATKSLTELADLNTGDTSPSGSIVKVASVNDGELPAKSSRAKKLGLMVWIGLTVFAIVLSTIAIVRPRSAPPTPPIVAAPPSTTVEAPAALASPPLPSASASVAAVSVAPEPAPSASPSASASAKSDAGPPKKKPKVKPKPKPAMAPADEPPHAPPALPSEL